MNLLIRLALVVLLVVPLGLCVFGLRFACDSADLRTLAWEIRRREELLQWRRETLRRIEVREEVVRELIAQQCSLKEALTRFQELDRERSDYIAKLSKTYGRDLTHVEEHYQYIIAIANDLLEDRAEEAAAVYRRLEKEYLQLRAGRHVPSAAPTQRTERSR
jgi:hypothetical protein